MNPKVSKIFRSIQVYFPGLQNAKFTFQRNIRKVLNKTHEEDFEVLAFLPETANNVFLDIGANRGDAVQSILLKRPEARVFAFEPNAYLTEKIKKLYKKDSRVTVYNTGLGNDVSSFPLFVPFYNNYMFDGLASFKRENAESWLRNRLYNYQESKLEVKEIMCSVRRLDEFNLSPFFMKIDVQGFEYEVLLGAEQTIRSSRPVILMEAPKQKELAFLSDLKYKAFIYKDKKLVGGIKKYNVFFIPKELISIIGENISIAESSHQVLSPSIGEERVLA